MSFKIDGQKLREMIVSGANNLKNNKSLIDKLNVFPVPDGDTGTNMSLTITSAIRELEKKDDSSISYIGKAISKGSLMGARGNSGVILSQIIRGFAKGIEDKEELTVSDFANALKLGSDTAYKAVIKPVEGTILTVVRESSEYAIKKASSEKDTVKFFEGVIREAYISLNKTPELLPALKEAGVVDSGAKGLIVFYEGMLSSLKGVNIELDSEDKVQSLEPSREYINSADIKFGYCTEFILESETVSPEKIRDLMLPLGDSLAVVGDEGLIKVHVHTNEPGNALQIALQYGSLATIKIENMRLQHENLLVDENASTIDSIKEEKEIGIIATSMGEGINEVLKSLNVDYIIEGGQTMNPSTQDFLDAIEKVNAKNIFIFPNNSNIIMSANQAKDLSDKNVIVIPTKNLPQCVVGLIDVEYVEGKSVEEITKTFNGSFDRVKCGQVTYAVRDTNMDGIEVKEGNYIGISNGKMKSSDTNIENVVFDTLDSMVTKDSSIITLYYGEEIDEDTAETLVEKIENKYEDVDVELLYGGQPVYYYIISVEE